MLKTLAIAVATVTVMAASAASAQVVRVGPNGVTVNTNPPGYGPRRYGRPAYGYGRPSATRTVTRTYGPRGACRTVSVRRAGVVRTTRVCN
jgi:hypothetical protein